MTDDKRQQYLEGYRNGHLDHLLRHKSEYVWNTRENEPMYQYAIGYRVGWQEVTTVDVKRIS